MKSPSPAPATRTAVVRGALLGLVVAGVLCLVRSTPIVDHIELDLVDLRTRLFAGSRGPDDRIVIVQVLENDVASVRRDLSEPWPWNLGINAAVFHVFAEAGAQCVVVDVLHLDRGAGPDDVPSTQPLSDAEMQRRNLEASQAGEYASAMKAIGGVVLAYELSRDAEYELPGRTSAVEHRLDVPSGEAPAGIVRPGANLPVRNVIGGASRLGFVTIEADTDGTVRRMPIAGRWGNRPVLSLPAAAAWQVAGGDATWSANAFSLASQSQRTNPDGSFLLNFRSTTQDMYPRVAPWQVIDWAMQKMNTGKLPKDAVTALKGKIIVWGVNVSGAEDVVASPLAELTDGPVMQATALDNLLHSDGRVYASRAWNLALLLLLGLLIGAIGGLGRAWIAHLSTFGAALLVVATAFLWFRSGTAMDLFTPLLGIGLTWGGTTALRAMTAGRYNRWLENTWGRYLAPSIIAAIKEDPSILELGGHRADITVLFSDVAGFTNISRSLPPQDLVRLLNEYLSDAAAAVMAEEGVVDKFEGDAVMAFFGDPIPQADHAVRGCRTALASLERLPYLRSTLDELGIDKFRVRIGLNSGEAVVGNMGSRERNDYTCMGDTVNLSARLEGANKVFGSNILIGPDTYEQAKDHIVAKPLAELVVVGWDHPVAVYELVAMRATVSPELATHVAAFGTARDALLAGRFADAQEALRAAEAARPEDGPTAWLREIFTQQEATGQPWDPILRMTQK